MRSTLLKYLDNFHRRGSEVAYVHRRGYRTVRWTYEGVALSACRFARELEARGISKGERVLIWGENCAEWVITFLGCMLRGVEAVPMDRIASPDFARSVVLQVDAQLCVCSRELTRHPVDAPHMVLEDLESLLAGHSGERLSPVPLVPEDTVEIVFTSGTTADPKGVVISHRNVLANLEPLETEIGKYLKYERIVHPLRFVNLLPLSHVFGQFLGIFIPQLLGATVIFQDTLNPSEIIHTIKHERVSVLVAVPRMLESLRDKIERDLENEGRLDWFREQFEASEGEHFALRWWRFRKLHNMMGWKFWAFISGGAALDYRAEQFWRRLGFVVIQGYGLTETTSLISVNHPFKLGEGSIGKVLPGREIKLAPNGEILVRGDSIASAYFKDRELQAVSGEEGWFHTGDRGEIDANGNLYFRGREKNVIVTAEGMNIFPEDLEAALRRQPEVRDCLVMGLEEDGNSEPCAVLLLADPSQDPEAVIKRANASLAEFQHIRRWFLWPDEDFPRTSTQKPRITPIKDFVRARAIRKEIKSGTTGALADLVARITGRPIGPLASNANLADDLQLSSIDRVELLSALEDRLQVDLNETRFTSATTVGELEQMLRQPAPERTDYHYPRWARSWPVAVLRFLVYYLVSWPATVLMAYPGIRGREHFKNLTGPVLVIANHITQVDIGFILAALPFRYRHRIAVAMLGEMLQEMRHPPTEAGSLRRLREQLSYFLVVALFNVFPLPQQTGFRRSFSYAGECADHGYSILVFPEGRRTPDGKLSPFRAGIGMLAKNLALPVVPMRIDGLFELKLKGTKFARPGSIQVSIGLPMRFQADADPEFIAADLERCMQGLKKGTA